jgi:hypothetical protein
MAKKSTEFYDILLALLRFVHQKEERGVSLKYAELDADVALKVADSISQVQNHPNWLNIAHFELIPTDEVSSESELLEQFSRGSSVRK